MPTFALNFSRPGATGRGPVLQLPAARLRGLPAGAAGLPGRGHAPGRARSPRWGRSSCSPTAATCRCSRSGCATREPPATRCSTCRSGCGSAAGWSRPTRSRENLQDTAVLRIVVRNGFSTDLAEALLDDLRTQVEALLKAQPARARAAGPRTGHGPAAASRTSRAQRAARRSRRASGALAEARPAPRPGWRRRRCRCAAPSRRPGASCTARRAAAAGGFASSWPAGRPQRGQSQVSGTAASLAKLGTVSCPVAAPEGDPDPRRGLAALRLAHRPGAHPAAADGVATTHCSPLASRRHGRTDASDAGQMPAVSDSSAARARRCRRTRGRR